MKQLLKPSAFGSVFATLLVMKPFTLKLLLLSLLLLLGEVSFANMTCKQALNFRYTSNTLRTPEDIADSKINQDIIGRLQESIVEHPNNLQPHSRNQCLGTCYIYSNQVLIENKLKLAGAIPEGSFLLMSPFIASVAMQRKASLGNLTTAELLYSGIDEALHSLMNEPVFYFSAEAILKLGNSKRLQELEEDFLKKFVELETFRFQGRTFSQILDDPYLINYLITRAFEKFIRNETGIDVTALNLTISSLTYTSILEPRDPINEYIIGHISTEEHPAFKGVLNSFAIALESHGPNPGDSFQKINEPFSTVLAPFISESLRSGNFVGAFLSAEIFNEKHAVTITNLVIDKESNELIGFLYLDSYSDDFGHNGYGFLSLLEAQTYIIHIRSLHNIEVQSPL